jgi:hypothetical protein
MLLQQFSFWGAGRVAKRPPPPANTRNCLGMRTCGGETGMAPRTKTGKEFRLIFLIQPALILLCGILGGAGCIPGTDSLLDEQKNPHYISGKERVNAHDYPGAIEAFEKALEVNPRSALAHFELGVLCEQRLNDYPAAIYHYNKVISLRPAGEYPAETAKIRIPACKQEMVKTDLLTTMNPAALQEQDRLREENQQLRRQLEQAQAQLAAWAGAARPASGASSLAGQAAAPGTRSPARDLRTPSDTSRGTPAPRAGAGPGGSQPKAGATRSYTVKGGDSLSRIARQQGVRLESLKAANPGVNPDRLKVGQTLVLPGP